MPPGADAPPEAPNWFPAHRSNREQEEQRFMPHYFVNPCFGRQVAQDALLSGSLYWLFLSLSLSLAARNSLSAQRMLKFVQRFFLVSSISLVPLLHRLALSPLWNGF